MSANKEWNLEMNVNALDIFHAYQQNKISFTYGIILSLICDPQNFYSIFEIILYNKIKSIHLSKAGLTFHCDANKFFIVLEAKSYNHSHIEPYLREEHKSIPHRFSELDTIRFDDKKVLISRNPIHCYAAFTILQPVKNDSYSYIFTIQNYDFSAISSFLNKTLQDEFQIPAVISHKITELMITKIKNFSL